MSGFLRVFSDQVAGHTVERRTARLFAFAGHLQMRNPTAFMPRVPDGELAQLLARASVIEQGSQNSVVPHTFQRFLGRGHEQLAGLVISNRSSQHSEAASEERSLYQ